MSSKIKISAKAFGIFLLLLSFSSIKVQAHPNKEISLQTFYDELSYYGEWIDNPDYGYVWRPDVERDFKPYYTNGRWAMTTYGNTWVSDYEWGWAPFHYGRWFYDDFDGWIWSPDTVWGPAWVSWRTGSGYYGWAPLGPRVNINMGRKYNIPNNYWVFIPQRCIYYPSYAQYWEPRRNVYIINNTTIINNFYTDRNTRYYTGPRPDDIRRDTRQNVAIYRITDDSRPGSTRINRGSINIYRPEIKKDGNSAAPRSIANNSPRPSRGSDTGVDRSRTSNPTTGRPQRPDAITNPGGDSRTDSSPKIIDRGNDNRSQRSDVGSSSSSDRPVRSANPSGNKSTDATRGNYPVREQQPPRGNDARTIQRGDAPASVERPTPAPRQEPVREKSNRPEKSQPASSSTRQETRPQSTAEPRQESSSSRSGNESNRQGNRPSNRGN